MEDKTLKSLLSKLRQPVHISYISKYILKKDERETELELNKLMEEGLIEESHMSKGYYVVKNQD
jgi:hypothetical protein